ncbi:hypothetical protein PFISCL1PPCAC_2920, partial [Pristionchus fissidentatus]
MVLRRFGNPESWNASDLLTSQPDDCLLKIFSVLDRDSLNSMRRVSQRMHSFADNFHHVKRQLELLSIVQITNGHIFYARLADSSAICFKYTIILKREKRIDASENRK